MRCIGGRTRLIKYYGASVISLLLIGSFNNRHNDDDEDDDDNECDNDFEFHIFPPPKKS